ncbi:unnamed protein product [Lactuca virosa]|uniref:MCM10 OB-fold domain-containing protein n=1 Tax=Lactuca virosa TaxID=75947 RepID=A0AAU9PU01_9ASTR|nr:unnamed protein product [Lactuca virosa]
MITHLLPLSIRFPQKHHRPESMPPPAIDSSFSRLLATNRRVNKSLTPSQNLTDQRGHAGMSVFRTAVEDCLDYEPEPSKKPLKYSHGKRSSDVDVENFSGLRIQNQLVSRTELSDRLADIRFVRLTAIK